MEIFVLIQEVGLPIAGVLVMGFFIFTIMQQMMNGLVNEIKTIEGMSKMLITRGSAMNNDIIKIDTIVSSALGDSLNSRVRLLCLLCLEDDNRCYQTSVRQYENNHNKVNRSTTVARPGHDKTAEESRNYHANERK